jgi:hypothetical protein
MGIFSWFSSSKSPEEPHWLRRWLIPGSGGPDPKLDEIKRAAAADVADMEEENRTYFRQDGPGRREDDL